MNNNSNKVFVDNKSNENPAINPLEALIEVKKLGEDKKTTPIDLPECDIETKVFALGGLEEIGKNTYCIEHGDELIMIDAGVKFPDATQLGIDAVVPDYTYLAENNKKVKALFITHGHEDHIGGIPYLLKKATIPVIYAPKLAAALIRDRIKEFKLSDKTVVKEYVEDDVYGTKHFQIRFCALNHSIPDAFGIHVWTPNGAIFSTGDYKFDWTPLGHEANIAKLSQIGNDGVQLLMADSTNAEYEGYTLGERKIIQNIDQIFLKARGRMMIASFASNVHRIQHIIELANKHGRKIVVIGRSIERIIKMIRQIGHLEIDDRAFIKPNEIENFPKNQILILCTGSQGEPTAALSRIANEEHQIITTIPGDTVIFSSSPIPGNRADVEKIVNKLTKLGVIVVENNGDNKVHTSGHASQEEQKILFNLLKPKYFMPMHGEFRMLKTHGETAVKVNVKKQNVFILANGDTIMMKNGVATQGVRIPADPIFIDGKDLSGQASNVIRERNILSKDGLISVVVSIDSKTNKMLSKPTVISRGSFYVKENGALISEMINIVYNSVNSVLKSNKPTFKDIKQVIKETVAPFIYRHKRRNPLIVPVILNKK